MKTFLTWLVIHIIVFAGAGFAAHAYLASNPKRVLIAVDSSHPMATQWVTAMDIVDRIGDDARYREFAVITDKGRVHGWTAEPELVSTLTYGPRQLNLIRDNQTYPEIDQADERILITNETGDIAGFGGWRIVRP